MGRQLSIYQQDVPATHRSAVDWSDDTQPSFLDPGALRDMLLARGRFILVAFLVLLTLGTLAILALPNKYVAASRVLIEPQANVMSSPRDVATPLYRADELVATEIEMLRSRPVLERAIAETDFRSIVAKGPPPTMLQSMLGGLASLIGLGSSAASWTGPIEDDPEPITDVQLLVGFGKAMEVKAQGDSRVLVISFEAHDPITAARAANAIARAYIAERLAIDDEEISQTLNWLTERIDELESNAVESASTAERFRAEAGLVAGAGVDLLAARLDQQSADLVSLRAELRELEQRAGRMQDAISRGDVDYVVSAADSPLLDQLRLVLATKMQEQARLGQSFGPRHPRMEQIRSDIAQINADIMAEATDRARALQDEASLLANRVRSTELENQRLEQEIASKGESSVKLSELEARAESSRELYDSVLKRLQEARHAETAQPIARLVSEALPPDEKSSPSRKILFLGLICFAISAAGGSALVLEMFRTGIRGPDELERLAGPGAYAVLPRFRPSQMRSAEHLLKLSRDASSGYGDGLQTLELMLRLREVTDRGAVVLATSARPGEGKSTTAAALAINVSCLGLRALLIDADFRRPVQAKLFRTARLNEEQADLLGVETLLHHAATGVDLLPAQTIDETQALSLSLGQLVQRLPEFRNHYDLVVIDTPPLLAVKDALVLCNKVDSVIMVVRWNRTPERIVRRAVRLLSPHAPDMLSFVLNDVGRSTYKELNYGYY